MLTVFVFFTMDTGVWIDDVLAALGTCRYGTSSTDASGHQYTGEANNSVLQHLSCEALPQALLSCFLWANCRVCMVCCVACVCVHTQPLGVASPSPSRKSAAEPPRATAWATHGQCTPTTPTIAQSFLRRQRHTSPLASRAQTHPCSPPMAPRPLRCKGSTSGRRRTG